MSACCGAILGECASRTCDHCFALTSPSVQTSRNAGYWTSEALSSKYSQTAVRLFVAYQVEKEQKHGTYQPTTSSLCSKTYEEASANSGSSALSSVTWDQGMTLLCGQAPAVQPTFTAGTTNRPNNGSLHVSRSMAQGAVRARR